jgi:hypothetical protein
VYLLALPAPHREGFLGGGVLTCVFSFFFPVLLARHPWFTCPAEQLTFLPPAIDSISCAVHSIFLPREYAVPALLGMGGGRTVELLPIQLHGIAYGLFASLVAPFGEWSMCCCCSELPRLHVLVLLFLVTVTFVVVVIIIMVVVALTIDILHSIVSVDVNDDVVLMLQRAL